MTSTDLTTPDDRTMDERARDMTITPPVWVGEHRRSRRRPTLTWT